MFEGLSVLYFPVSCGFPLTRRWRERFPTQCSPPRFAAVELYLNRRQPRFSEIQPARKDDHQQKAPIPGHRFHSRPWTLPSEKVTTQVRIGIGYSKEERQRIICCCRQVLHEESKLIGERFGAKPSGPARIRRFPQKPSKSRFLSRLFPPPSARPAARDRIREGKNHSSSRTRAPTACL